jgi:hypothetical protein
MCSACCQIGTWWHIPGCSQSLGHSWPETKCPDLGDWSDTPHDVLDEPITFRGLWIMIDSIRLDQHRTQGYIED